MNNIYIDGYKRITKTTACKLFAAGETIRICPVKISPVNMWGYYSDITANKNQLDYANSPDGFNTSFPRNTDFETLVTYFTYYNCTAETGKYLAYYIKEA